MIYISKYLYSGTIDATKLNYISYINSPHDYFIQNPSLLKIMPYHMKVTHPSN